MSYILEALKRAEAERERERAAVPGLNAQPMAAAEPAGAPGWLRPALWAGGGAVVVLAGVVGWRWQAGSPTAPAAAPAAGQVALASAPAPMPAALPAPAPAVPSPPAAMQPAQSAAPATVAAPVPGPAAATVPPAAAAPAGPQVMSPLSVNGPVGVRMTPAPGFAAHLGQRTAGVAAQVTRPAPPPADGAAAQRPVAPIAQVPPPAPAVQRNVAPPTAVAVTPAAQGRAPVAPAPAATERVYANASELPGDARGGVPPLAIGGSIYSPNPSARFIIINGQVLHEGDEVANGLKLEKIELKSAVLNYRGYRFRVAY